MKIELKPLSVNQVWCGKRFKTPIYKQYERDLSLLLSVTKCPFLIGYVELDVKFYIKSFAISDVDNFLKPMIDIIVKNGLIQDDKFIKKITAEKFKSDYDYMEINLKKYEN